MRSTVVSSTEFMVTGILTRQTTTEDDQLEVFFSDVWGFTGNRILDIMWSGPNFREVMNGISNWLRDTTHDRNQYNGTNEGDLH